MRGRHQLAKGVFDTKTESGYDDQLERRYHFPARSNYVAVAQAVVGDWILYREPQRNGGRRAYIGAARVTGIEPDPQRADHAYANVAEYFAFEPPVGFAAAPEGRYWEAGLRGIAEPSRVGQALQGRSLRLISDQDFAAIVDAGLGETLEPANAFRYGPGLAELDLPGGAPALEGLPGEDFVRRVEETLVNRKIREANFRRLVCQAYDDTCAVTRLRIINGGGRSEAQAAHIWPVAEGGPDVVQNGIALCATAHWLFDRHLISVTDDYRLLVSHNKVPEALRGLFARQLDRIHLPADERLRPHPAYLRRHREAFLAA